MKQTIVAENGETQHERTRRQSFLAHVVTNTSLTQQEAEALYRRQNGEGRREAAEAMYLSPSIVDELERAARRKVMKAEVLLSEVDKISEEDADPTAYIGTCARCDKPAPSLAPHPDDEDRPDEDCRQVCENCLTDLE